MNKKVSTIFSMVALMGGSLFSSAYAENISTPITDALEKVSKDESVMLKDNSGQVLGLVKLADGTKVVRVSSDEVNKAEVLNYTWFVRMVPKNQVQTKNYYIFENVITGDTLSFKKDGTLHLVKDKDWANKHQHIFSFGTDGAAYSKTPASFFVHGEDGKMTQSALTLTAPKTVMVKSGTSNPTFTLHKLATANADIHELNALYNGKGFNLGVKPDLTSTDVVDGNLFDSETQRIWAYEVTTAYELPDNGSGNKLYVPKGVYFFTNPVFKNGKGAADYVSGTLQAKDIDWLNSSLIALSPTETLEATDVARGEGEGFKLIVEKGTNFIFDGNTSDFAGEDLAIWNACFTVKTNYSANYPYAVSLDKFFYQKKANYQGTDKQANVAAYLGVSSYNNAEQSLVSMKGSAADAEYLFFLKASSVLDGKKLLHTTKKAAIYTIKFISGQSSDKDLVNKYLTVGSNGSDFQWEAKGNAIAETDFPIFQFVITAVDKDNNVTFTNRETGKSFTTQLFPENGTNRYSLATSNISEVIPFTVNTTSANTYEVVAQDQNKTQVGIQGVKFDSDIIVELQRLDDVDQFAGFLNTEDKAIRTLAFARDKNDTSNKFYSVVEDRYEGNDFKAKSLAKDVLSNDLFVNDIADAAQWQLVKGGANTISRVYVYNNTATESVDDVPNGDKVSAYVYSLRYVTDGTETDWFLQNNYDASSNHYDLTKIENVEKASDITEGAAKFYIKENVDGSVSLMAYDGAFKNQVAAAGEEKALDVEVNQTTGVREYALDENVYQSESASNDIKTYLDPKPIEISWQAEEGHITLKSDFGNYITMNENRDAIVINETEADKFYLYVTDKDAIVPSFYLTKGIGAENGDRMFMFNPVDSVNYYVAPGDFDRKYQWKENTTKVLFKAASINETRDTLSMNVKGEMKKVAMKADDNDKNIWGGLNRFKFQIIETGDADGYYYVRQLNSDNSGNYLASWNEKLTWSDKAGAMRFTVEETTPPTSNEGVSTSEVKVVANDGSVVVKNAAGKNVVVSTILGQVVANEVLTSDNATINVPAGIVVVSVDGESFKVNVR